MTDPDLPPDAPGAPARRRYALAVDLGTSVLKVGLVSLRGEVAWTTSADIATTLTDNGGAEQDAAVWWQLISDGVRAAIGSGAVPPDQIAAVSVTGQWASTVPVAADGTPVGPCLLWMDSRGAPHARQRFGGPVSGYSARTLTAWVRKTGGAPSTSGADPLGHMLAFAHDRPEVARATRWYLEPVDYVSMRFTGTAAASPASMTAAWLTDNRHLEKMAYDAALVRMAGVDGTKLPPLVPTGSVIGPIAPDVAAAFGLRPDVQVVTGSPDLHSAAAGTGTGTVSGTRSHLALSTTSWISCAVGFKKTDVLRQLATVPGVLPDNYLVANNHETGGACLRWLRDQVFGRLPGAGQPEFDDLTALAATVPPGSRGVIFTPWLAGERSPVDDRNARGGFHNLSLDAGLPEMTRAVLEGVAYNSRWLHEAVEHFVKRKLEPVRIFGGGAISDLWCQIHADVMDRTVERVADPNHVNLRGAAILAGIALGELTAAEADGLPLVGTTFTPGPSRRAVYDRLYAEFPRLYKSQKPMFARLARA